MAKPIKRILTIDGGGLRGVFSAAVIEQMEVATGRPANQLFDCICGTSAGSFLAAGLASGIGAKQLKGIFLEMRKAVFDPTEEDISASSDELSSQDTSAGRKSSLQLEKVLKATFGEKRPTDCKTELIIPARNMALGKVVFFGSLPPDEDLDSSFFSNSGIEENQELWKIVLRSAALPPHFAPAGNYLDGGISPFANPCYAAFMGVQRRLGWSAEHMQLNFHSVGTGFHIQHRTDIEDLPEERLASVMVGAMMQDIVFLQHLLMKRRAVDVGIEYKRYNVRFDEAGFKAMRLKLPDSYSFDELASTSKPPMEKLAEIGTEVGLIKVDEADFTC